MIDGFVIFLPKYLSPGPCILLPQIPQEQRKVVTHTKWSDGSLGTRNWRSQSLQSWCSCFDPAAGFLPSDLCGPLVWINKEINRTLSIQNTDFAPSLHPWHGNPGALWLCFQLGDWCNWAWVKVKSLFTDIFMKKRHYIQFEQVIITFRTVDISFSMMQLPCFKSQICTLLFAQVVWSVNVKGFPIV